MKRTSAAPLLAMMIAVVAPLLLAGSTVPAAPDGSDGTMVRDLKAAETGVVTVSGVRLVLLDPAVAPPRLTETELQAADGSFWRSMRPSWISYDYGLLTALPAHAFPWSLMAGDPTLGRFAGKVPVWVVSVHGAQVVSLGNPAPPGIGTWNYLYDAFSGKALGGWTSADVPPPSAVTDASGPGRH